MSTPLQFIAPASVEWAYPDMATDYNAGADTWREVSEGFTEENLNVLPPIYCDGGFMVSEPYTHDCRGREVYAGFVQVGERYFARYSSRRDFPELVRRLHLSLGKAS